MGLCEFCSRFDFREIALIGSGSGNEEWTRKWEESDGSSCCVEHHKNLAEFEECALDPSGCELCLLFFVTLGQHQEDLHYDSESEQSVVGEDAMEKAKQFLELRPTLMDRPLYIGPAQMRLSFHRYCPGIGLWVKKDLEDNWSGTTDTDNETWHSLSSLEFFFKRDAMPPESDPLVKQIWMRDIQETSRAPECIDIAKRWLRNCLENHSLCQTAAPFTNSLPTRVIDVGSEHQDPRLVVTNGSTGTYAALSYCWGSDKSKHMVLTGKFLTQFQKGMPLSSFPETLRDAIHMVRELGIRFLWIDALCIIQDSAEDWMKEAAKMNEVYSNSVLTLFATTSSSSDDGFFGERVLNPECSLPCTPPSARGANPDFPGDTEPGILFVRFFNHVAHQLDTALEFSEPWTTRGWTLQERLSPARGITFTKVQMHWHCLMGSEFESGSRDDVDSGRRDSVVEHMTDVIGSGLLMTIAERWCTITRMRNSTFRGVSEQQYRELTIMLWYQLVSIFQERSLSFQSDRLPAVAGLAKILEDCFEGKDRYWAGLWGSDWATAFCWRAVPDFEHPDFEKDTHEHKEGTPQAPSWSWASIITGGSRSWIRGEEIGKGNFTTRSLMVLQTPHDTTDEERFVPTKPIVLRITAPAKQLSQDWTCTSGSTENLGLVQAAFEKLLRRHLHIENRPTVPDFLKARTRKLQKRSEFAQKHNPYPGQKYLAMQILERTPSESDLIKPDDTWESYQSEIFFLILESEPGSHRRYRRIAEIRLKENASLEERYYIMEREGTKIYEGTLLPMVKKQQWQVEEIELV